MATLGSLFSGFGLLDLGLSLVGFDPIWHAELTPAASRVLEAHWPGVPNLGDVTAVDWSALPRPDLMAGGFPCPPFSSAGKRLGRDDPRYLWPVFAGAIRAVRPRAVLLENVAALLSADTGAIFGDVLGDLAEAGYDCKWACVRASDVGAPHRRERVFIAAYARGEPRWEVARGASGDEGPHGPHGADVAGSGGEAPADAPHDGRAGSGEPRGRRHRPSDCGDLAPDSDRSGCGWVEGTPDGWQRLHEHVGDDVDGRGVARWGSYAAAIERWEHLVGERAPDPLDERGRLNVELVRWMMSAPPGWHGDLSRTAAIKGYGNGVVAQLAERLGRWVQA